DGGPLCVLNPPPQRQPALPRRRTDLHLREILIDDAGRGLGRCRWLRRGLREEEPRGPDAQKRDQPPQRCLAAPHRSRPSFGPRPSCTGPTIALAADTGAAPAANPGWVVATTPGPLSSFRRRQSAPTPSS